MLIIFQFLDDGQTCDLAYEMFECVSQKIDEVCIEKNCTINKLKIKIMDFFFFLELWSYRKQIY